MPQRTTAIRKQYGSAQHFLQTFNPDLQFEVSQHLERAYLGTAPALGAVKECYGEQTAIVFVCTQLESINLFAGAKEKLTVEQQVLLAKLFITEYPYLRVTEFQLFVYRLKCGRYGNFYGVVDAMFITSVFILFLGERRTELLHFEAERKRREQQEASSQQEACITYQEYLDLKQTMKNIQK